MGVRLGIYYCRCLPGSGAPRSTCSLTKGLVVFAARSCPYPEYLSVPGQFSRSPDAVRPRRVSPRPGRNWIVLSWTSAEPSDVWPVSQFRRLCGRSRRHSQVLSRGWTIWSRSIPGVSDVLVLGQFRRLPVGTQGPLMDGQGQVPEPLGGRARSFRPHLPAGGPRLSCRVRSLRPLMSGL